MKIPAKYLFFIVAGWIVASAASAQTRHKVTTVEWNLTDTARQRPVPVWLYLPVSREKDTAFPLVILSHGYWQNRPGSYRQYSELAHHLAANGYVVASIQHELPTDSLLPVTGIPQVVRRSNWERGAENIRFVYNTLKQSNYRLDFSRVTLLGHSNGGDMSALFVHKYPGAVQKLITLDNRRMALPHTGNPQIYSLRSSDQPADEGVLPSEEEQKMYRIRIIRLPATIHNNMDNSSTGKQQKEINTYVLDFLKE